MRHAKYGFLPFTLALSAALLLGGCSPPPSPQAQLQKAREYAASGKDRAALVELRNLVQKHPDIKQARLALGTLLLRLGDPAAAAVQLEQAQRLGAAADGVELPLAQALIQTNKFKDALNAIHPEKFESARLRAALLTAKGEAQLGLQQRDAAARSFTAALGEDPKFARAVAGRAALALLDNHPELAIGEADKALALDAGDGLARMLKGMALFDRKQYAEAEKSLAKALAIGSPQLSPSQLFLTRGHLAQAQIAIGQRGEARKNIDVMLRQAPKHPYPNYLRGVLAYEEKDYANAAQYLQTALNANPYDVNALTLLGASEGALGHDVLAANYLSSALAQDPHNAAAKHLLASLQMRSGQSQKAIDTLSSAEHGGMSSNDILSLFPSPNAAIKALSPLTSGASSSTQDASIKLALAQALLTQGESQRALSVLGTVSGNGNTELNAQRLKAAAYLRGGQADKAIAIARDIVSQHPADTNALRLSAMIFLAAGSSKEAEATLKKAQALTPDDPGVTNSLGALMLREGRLSEAVDAFRTSVRHDPRNLFAQMALARVAAARGQGEEALKWLEKAVATNPKALAPLIALTQYQVARKDTAQAVATAKRAVVLAPDKPAILVLLARAQLENGQGQSALKTFAAAAEAAPNDPRYGLSLATAQFALKQPKAAETTLSAIVAKHPGYVPAVRALAITQLHNKDTAGAFATADTLAQRPHGKAFAAELKGDLYNLQKRFSEAQTAYARALELAPSRELTLKAFASGVQAHAAHAARPLLAWLKQHPHDADIRANLANYYLRQKQPKEAEAQYRQALRDAPNNPVILNNLAWLSFQAGKADALSLAEKAHRIAPHDPEIADTLGWILTRSGRAGEAVPILEKAAAENKHAPSLQYHYAAALAQAGQSGQALRVLEPVLADKTPFPERTQAEALMRRLQVR